MDLRRTTLPTLELEGCPGRAQLEHPPHITSMYGKEDARPSSTRQHLNLKFKTHGVFLSLLKGLTHLGKEDQSVVMSLTRSKGLVRGYTGLLNQRSKSSRGSTDESPTVSQDQNHHGDGAD